jgi:hypothetical protein
MTGFLASLAFILLFTANFVNPAEQTCELDGTCADNCVDQAVECQVWAQENQCDSNREFMLSHCPKSCDACAEEVEENVSEGETKSYAQDEFGLLQVSDVNYHAEIAQAIEDMKAYIRNAREDPGTTPKMSKILDNCKNNHESCAFWKVIGECEKVRSIGIGCRNLLKCSHQR